VDAGELLIRTTYYPAISCWPGMIEVVVLRGRDLRHMYNGTANPYVVGWIGKKKKSKNTYVVFFFGFYGFSFRGKGFENCLQRNYDSFVEWIEKEGIARVIFFAWKFIFSV
jgi:hypothetical protein